MRRILLASVFALGASTATPVAHAQDWNSWQMFLVPNPDSKLLPPVGLTLRGLTLWINVKAATDTPVALVLNNTDHSIEKIACNGYVIAGIGSAAKYHNPDSIPAHTGALVNFDYASNSCSNHPIDFVFDDGNLAKASGDGSTIYKSTKVVVSTK